MARLPRISGTIVAIFALLLWPMRALAADAQAVAHVSFSDGTVSLRSVGGEVAAAAIDMPLSAGDELTTGRGSLCEVQLDAATMFRIGARTSALLTDLSAGRREFRLDRGDVEMRVFRAPADARVRTPSITVVAREPGTYRVSVDANGETDVVVRSGRAAVPLPESGELTLLPGTTLVATGSPADPAIAYRSTLAEDDFDRWNDARDDLAGVAPISTLVQLGQPLGLGALSPGGLGLAALSGYGSALPWLGSGAPPWLSSAASPWFGGGVPGWLGTWGPMLVGAAPFFSSNGWGFSPFGPTFAGWMPLVPVEVYQPYLAIGGRTYTHPNWKPLSLPANMRYLQRSVVGAPMRVTPAIRMSAPMHMPGHVSAPVVRVAPSRTIAVPSARR